jgi:O-methyltransferase involved in polyketide biosynthesis
MRAEETRREERLIDDPYAALFVAAAPPLFADVPLLADDASLAALVESGIAGVALRTRYFDDAVETACTAGRSVAVIPSSSASSTARPPTLRVR